MLDDAGKNRFAGVKYWALWDFKRKPWYTVLVFDHMESVHGVAIYTFRQHQHPGAQTISITETGLLSGVVRPFCLSRDSLDILSYIEENDPYAPI